MHTRAIKRILDHDPHKNRAKGSVRRIYTRLFRYVWKHKRSLFIAMTVLVFLAFIQAILPQMPGFAIDRIIPERDLGLLAWMAAAMLFAALLLGVFQYISQYTMSVIGQRTIYELRNDIYGHLQGLSMSFFDRKRTGELMSRVTHDVNTLQQLITAGIMEMVRDLLVFIVILSFMFYADWKLTLLLAMTFPIMIYTTRKFSTRLRGAYKEVQEQTAQMNDRLQDTLSNMKLIKAFANESFEKKRFNQTNQGNMLAHIRAVRLGAIFSPLIGYMNHLGMAIVLIFGTWQVLQDALTVGQLVTFLVYLRMVQQPIRRFSRIINVVQQAAAASERIFEILDTKPDVKEARHARPLPPIQGHVKFESVSFSYIPKDDEGGKQPVSVLKDISLELLPGKTYALVGPSGAGKTTITHLISRFYDPQAGSVLVDGQDIREVAVHSLRNQIGIVTQEIMLLNGTVRENILYGKPDASEEEMIEAAKMANAHHFILQFADGYDTQIGERGVKLSGGQRQRLSIARALLKNPRLLILDEATSSLDTESEHLIQEALDTLLSHGQRTSLVIAHRLSTIKQSDQIIVLNEGKVVEQGTHDDLMTYDKGLYRRLHDLQFPQTIS